MAAPIRTTPTAIDAISSSSEKPRVVLLVRMKTFLVISRNVFVEHILLGDCRTGGDVLDRDRDLMQGLNRVSRAVIKRENLDLALVIIQRQDDVVRRAHDAVRSGLGEALDTRVGASRA